MKARSLSRLITIAGLVCAISATTMVAANPQVVLDVGVEREEVTVNESGTSVVERRPVTRANPGDLLVYTVTASNFGVSPAANATVEDPIPSGTVLVLDGFGQGPLPTEASLDGGETWQTFPAEVEVVRNDGVRQVLPAPAPSYTHLRWVLDGQLAPGDSKDVSFKVRVN